VRSETPYISGTSTTFGAKPTNRTANTQRIPVFFKKLEKSKIMQLLKILPAKVSETGDLEIIDRMLD
jgi:hypothetical protein